MKLAFKSGHGGRVTPLLSFSENSRSMACHAAYREGDKEARTDDGGERRDGRPPDGRSGEPRREEDRSSSKQTGKDDQICHWRRTGSLDTALAPTCFRPIARRGKN